MPGNMPSIPLSKLPLISSDKVIKALVRLDCSQGSSRTGSHVAYQRRTIDGRVATTVVIVGKREMAKMTLRGILYGLEIPVEDFLEAVR